MPRLAIRSTSPDSSWVEEFVVALCNNGLSQEEIMYFSHFKGVSQSVASDLYKQAERKANIIVMPLLRPGLHKHYLTSIAELYQQLSTDPRVILVYDVAGLRTQTASQKHPVTTESVLNLINWLKKLFPERIFGRAEAIVRLAHLRTLQATH